MYFTELHITPFCNHHLSTHPVNAHLKNASAHSFENFSAKIKVYLILNVN